MLAYMESGFPLFIGMDVDGDGHAIVAAGHNWKKGAVAATNHVWGQVDTLLTVDDNLLPYVTVPVDQGASDGAEPDYSTENFESFIVALPEKVGYPAEAMAEYAGVVESRLLIRVMGCEPESVSLHRYFMTTISGLRRYARGERVTARQDARGTHNAAGYGAVRVGLGVFERGAMGWWTSGSTRHRRCIGESQGSGPYLAAAQRGGGFRVRPVDGGTCCADSWSQSTW